MESADLPSLTISDLAKLYSAKEVSPTEVVEATLERIASLNGRLNAFVTVTAEGAMEAARQAERDILSGAWRGPLHGVPISLKDIFWTRGVRTTCGSKIMADFVPEEDATVVERLRTAGAILVGKTNLHEFAYGVSTNNPHYGPTRNPWDLSRIPGGSSGGSGAAVAASMCVASLGTDTGGSIRIPASLCGIVGLKPTFGRVSKFGVLPLAWSIDHIGPMTKCVEDAAIMLKAIAGYDPKDATSSAALVPDYGAKLDGGLKGLRIGVPQDYFYSGLDAEVEAAVRSALGIVESLGGRLVAVSLPEIEHAHAASSALVPVEAAAYHADNLRARPQDYGPDVRLRLELGEFVRATEYVNAQRIRAKLIQGALGTFKQVDAILTPTLPVTATLIDEVPTAKAGGREAEVRKSLTAFTSPINVLGFPAVSVPCGFSSTGLPIGLQVVGKPFAEEMVLRVAYAYEKAAPWHLRQAPV